MHFAVENGKPYTFVGLNYIFLGVTKRMYTADTITDEIDYIFTWVCIMLNYQIVTKILKSFNNGPYFSSYPFT